MISRLELENFKCFVHADVSFRKLNVFAGSNGAGKSTLVQALLLLHQSSQTGALARGKLQLNGSLVELGTGRDVLFSRSNADTFGIAVTNDRGVFRVSASVPSSDNRHVLDVIQSEAVGARVAVPSPFAGRLFYLSADRLAPQKQYPMDLEEVRDNEVGRRGEFAPLLLVKSRGATVTNQSLLIEDDGGKTFTDIDSQFVEWMRKLFPGFGARTDGMNDTDSIVVGLTLQRQIGEAAFQRPTNVGFGVSVVFPIIVCGLLADADTTLIVENPEAHLHPSAQSLIGTFLARVASHGTQVFVETHSDHVINGVRIAIKQETIASQDVRFVAFARDETFGSHQTQYVEVNKDGRFANRPTAFFDQMDSDLRQIFDL